MDELIYFYPSGHEDHYEPGHPESPERIEIIRESLIKVNWWEKFPKITWTELPQTLLESVHNPAYLNLLELACKRGSHLDMDTYTTPFSWKLAKQAAGGAVSVVSAVWNGKARRGIALTRPPGHHAMRGQGMGFCLLNNIALAAEYLIQNEDAKTLAIVDLDLHHGNGTQNIFWKRGDVFYISTHQSPFYPGSGSIEEIGVGDGFKRTANFPLPPGSGDVAFITIMDELILKLLDLHKPEMILVSYGYDTHWSDPLGQLLLSAKGYRMLIERLVCWADQNCHGRIALIMEGGYNLDAGCACTQAVISALLGIDWQDYLGYASYPEGNAWKEMFRHAKNLWGL